MVAAVQCLYADTFMSREEFREMFNHELYDRMRKKYDAIGAFPEVSAMLRGTRRTSCPLSGPGAEWEVGRHVGCWLC